MASGANENSPQKKHGGTGKSGKGSPVRRTEKGNRPSAQKSVQKPTLSGVEKNSSGNRQARGAKALRRSRSGLDPREAIDEWLKFAQEKNHRRVTGKRRFDSDLERVDTFLEEEKSLFDFCRKMGFSFFEKLAALQQGPTTHEGVEHRVFYSLADDPPRATKITFPGRYGRIEHTPFLYLERLALFNELFPELDIRFEDCVANDKGDLMLITSMQAFPGPHPDLNEIDVFLRRLGFVPHSDGSTTIDYRNPRMGIIVRDCHPKNWARAEGGHLVPIDISPEIG